MLKVIIGESCPSLNEKVIISSLHGAVMLNYQYQHNNLSDFNISLSFLRQLQLIINYAEANWKTVVPTEYIYFLIMLPKV